MLTLDVELPTVDDYNTFKAALSNGEITITISEYVSNDNYIEGPGGGDSGEGGFGGD